MQPRWIFLAEFAVVAFESFAFLAIGCLLCKRHKWAYYVCIIIGAGCVFYRVLTSIYPQRFYIPLPYLIVTGVITPAGYLLLAAALAPAKKNSRQRILIGVFSVVLTYYVFCDVGYLLVEGPEIARLVGQWEHETMRQSRIYTCGPAAGAALLQTWGLMVREGELAFAARTSFRGTELPRLADAIRFFGRYKPLTVKIKSVTFDELYEMNRPAVLLVEKGRLRHVVTLLKMHDGKITIADPSNGTRELSIKEFWRIYGWDGRAIVAWRDPNFQRLSHEPPEPFLHR